MPSFRAFTTTASGSSDAPAISTPAGTVSGDAIFVMIKWGNATNDIDAVPTGFTAFTGTPLNPGGGSGVRYGVYYKISDGTEGATLTFSLVSSGSWRLAAFTYQDVSTIDQSVPLGDTDLNSTTSGTSIVIPIMTVARAGSLAIVFNMYDGTSATWTQPTSFTERMDAGGMSQSDLGYDADTGTLTSTKTGGADICAGFGAILQPSAGGAAAPLKSSTLCTLGVG